MAKTRIILTLLGPFMGIEPTGQTSPPDTENPAGVNFVSPHNEINKYRNSPQRRIRSQRSKCLPKSPSRGSFHGHINLIRNKVYPTGCSLREEVVLNTTRTAATAARHTAEMGTTFSEERNLSGIGLVRVAI